MDIHHQGSYGQSTTTCSTQPVHPQQHFLGKGLFNLEKVCIIRMLQYNLKFKSIATTERECHMCPQKATFFFFLPHFSINNNLSQKGPVYP